MENLKIRVTTEQESKEAQELFFELGGDFYLGGKLHCNTHLGLVTINKDSLMANIELDGLNYKEITIPQLRDMVVLKRNCVEDATHYDSHITTEKIKCILVGEWWNAFTGGKWQKHCHVGSGRAKYMKHLKEEVMKEYLDKDHNLRQAKQTSGNNHVPSGWIEVPEGAEILTIIFNNKVFYKSGNPFKWFDANAEKWRECSSVVEFDGFEDKLWQRGPLNDKVASAEVARQKHSHYKKDVSHLKSIDVYRVLDLFNVEGHEVGHAIKKLLCSGQRGAKDHKQDIQEAIDSLNRHLEMLAEDEAS